MRAILYSFGDLFHLILGLATRSPEKSEKQEEKKTNGKGIGKKQTVDCDQTPQQFP